MNDYILINKFGNEKYLVSPLINGLSDHDSQVLSLFNTITPDDNNEFYSYKEIHKHSSNGFQASLSYEIWEDVFINNDDDTNTIFNNILNTFLRNLYACFPPKKQKVCKIPIPGYLLGYKRRVIIRGNYTLNVGTVMILN